MLISSLCIALQAGTPAVAGMPDPWTHAARYTFEYRVSFSRMDGREGERVRVWVPYPAETRDQTVVDASIDAPWPHELKSDGLGNRVLYMEGHGVPGRDLVMRFTIDRKPSHGIPADEIRPNTPLDPDRYRRAQRLIPLDGVIRQIAEKESRGMTSDEKKIRAFYDYVVRTMRYNKDGKGWGRGDAIWACDNKRGNCTDIHSLFIGMARSQGIAARFVIGFPIPTSSDAGPIGGYHCWSEYYDERRGWVPLDASEAKKSGKTDAYFGALPNDRVEFTVGRDLILDPQQDGGPLNFFIYPYAEADGEVVAARDLEATFRFERVSDEESSDERETCAR
jgi:transglutaminase-like putative cysteine protease